MSFMEKKTLSLKEHQEIIYDLLYTLDDFCKKHNIRYFLAHGTLLGAIRHHGLIPWDDDADVMMEREEYERFKSLITNNPPKGYKGYNIDNTHNYYYPFIKFGKLGTCLVEHDWKCVPKEGIGVNIDVFPIDGCPNNVKEAQIYVVQKMNERFDLIHYWCDLEYKDFVGIRQKLYYFYYRIRKHRVILRPYLKHIYTQVKQYQLKDSTYFFSFWTFRGARNLFPKSCISELIDVPFGNRNLPIPRGYDEMLKIEYGDYLIPPSEKGKESTHRHDVYILK